MLKLSFTIPASLDGRTAEQLLHTGLSLPDGLISHLKYIPEGITLNDAPIHTNTRVHSGDILAARIDDADASNSAEPIDCGVRIVWEDEYLAMLAKPAGICVHGVPGGTPTVENAAAYFWGQSVSFHPINRLDRGTSGLMLAAKCRLLHSMMQTALHSDRFRRTYLAVTEGEIPPCGSIDIPISGKPALTDYERLSFDGRFSLVRLTLHTGRTHQIRIHMASIGHPLAGDVQFGGGTELSRPALHSWQAEFVHPVTGERLCFTEPMPEDMRELVGHQVGT